VGGQQGTSVETGDDESLAWSDDDDDDDEEEEELDEECDNKDDDDDDDDDGGGGWGNSSATRPVSKAGLSTAVSAASLQQPWSASMTQGVVQFAKTGASNSSQGFGSVCPGGSIYGGSSRVPAAVLKDDLDRALATRASRSSTGTSSAASTGTSGSVVVTDASGMDMDQGASGANVTTISDSNATTLIAADRGDRKTIGRKFGTSDAQPLEGSRYVIS
jgi:hypothetical protein